MSVSNWFIGGATLGLIGLGAAIIYRDYQKEKEIQEMNEFACSLKDIFPKMEISENEETTEMESTSFASEEVLTRQEVILD